MSMTAADHSVAYLQRLHAHGAGMIEITGLGVRSVKRYFAAGDFVSAVAHAHDLNGRGFNVFANVNPRKAQRGRIEDTACVTALPLDWDFNKGVDPSGVLELMHADGVPPTLTVRSGHGLHAFFLLRDPAEIAAAKPVAKRLCVFSASDRVHNANRIMRLPGSVNWKEPAAWCLLDSISDRAYDLDEVDGWLERRGAAPAVIAEERAEVLLPISPPSGWAELRERLSARAVDAVDFGMQNSSKQETRSHTDWMVICELVRCGATDDQIRWVYATQPIGALKYREAGEHYLNWTIKEARKHALDVRAA